MITNSNIVTAAYVKSESGDHYLMVLEGSLTDEEIKAAMYWEEADCLCVEEKEVVEFR